ncbi:MAG: hypothetical protein Kow0092_05730 [Deferrisomatales bacterium]
MEKGRVWLIVLGVLAVAAGSAYRADAFNRYNDGCQMCHGKFTDGTSPKGLVFPSGDKHKMHRDAAFMATDCNLCHTSGDGRNPFLGSSDGTPDNPGMGCTGCHEKYGLRAHHAVNGVTMCAGCHPGDPPPPPEGTLPVYYGTPDTLADSPCNPLAQPNVNENWTVGDFQGLDNDGDNLYDTADPDCQLGPEVECFDGVDNDGDGAADCADSDCDGAVDGPCDTGQPGVCAAGTAVCANGGSVCMPDNAPAVEGPFGDRSCVDGLDNDCDGLTDGADPDCEAAPEAQCFDGVDNDGDGATDCADPDCAGAVNGPCDTGQPGLCGPGVLSCMGGMETCAPDAQPVPEVCDDGLDNDCDGLTDGADPDCQVVPEACFNGMDDDGDGLADCADPDCEGAVDGPCDTGRPGLCGPGMLSCMGGMEACVPDAQPVPEVCDDGLDNDCDGLADGADPDCQVMQEACFNGMDDDMDGLADCADPDCEGASDGPCDTGRPGICAEGVVVCSGGVEVCEGTVGPQPEGTSSGNCRDGLDNDCDGAADAADPDCLGGQMGDVFLERMKAPKKVKSHMGRTERKKVDVRGGADTLPQEATVTLFATAAQGVGVELPGPITKEVMPGDEETRFRFPVRLTCKAEGEWMVEWTAVIDAAENRDPDNDTVSATTRVRCGEERMEDDDHHEDGDDGKDADREHEADRDDHED